MKKTVNVLIMEPKNSLMDIAKEAIRAKPDENYDIVIVGTATTAKGGYFELYKHRPHILFLNPQLEDEDGVSFIKHALERLPYLKIIVMATQFIEKEPYLDGGAHAVAHVPIQRASLWRIIDKMIEEIDEIGLLDVSEYIPETENTPSLQEEELFVIDLDKKPEYTPIFEDVFNNTKEDPDDHNGEQNHQEIFIESESVVVDDEELTSIDFLDHDKTSDEVIDDENLIFDPFTSPEKDENKNHQSSDVANDIKELNSKDQNQELDIFKFEDDEKEGALEKELELTSEDTYQDCLNDGQTLDYIEKNVDDNAPTPNKKEKDFQLNHIEIFDESKESSLNLKEAEETSDNSPTTMQSVSIIHNGSNHARTELTLYSDSPEYNKSTLKESRSFDSGFYNRNGEFVPIYPPREMFAGDTYSNIIDVNVEKTNRYSTSDISKEPVSEEGLFSSVKKLFKRH